MITFPEDFKKKKWNLKNLGNFHLKLKAIFEKYSKIYYERNEKKKA